MLPFFFHFIINDFCSTDLLPKVFALLYKVPDQFADGAPGSVQMAQNLAQEGILQSWNLKTAMYSFDCAHRLIFSLTDLFLTSHVLLSEHYIVT